VALSRENNLLAFKESKIKNSHSSVLTVFIEDIFKEANLKLSDVDAISVCKGPGSYTGLRIGVSSAKGLAYGLDKKLISVNTLTAMAFGMIKKENKKDFLYCPMLDARRMEVYTALYDFNLNEIGKTSAKIITEESFKEVLEKNKIIFFGDGAEKCKYMLEANSNALFVDDFSPSAKYMLELSYQKFLNKDFENVIYFEPYYLKDFVATTPANKIFRQ